MFLVFNKYLSQSLWTHISETRWFLHKFSIQHILISFSSFYVSFLYQRKIEQFFYSFLRTLLYMEKVSWITYFRTIKSISVRGFPFQTCGYFEGKTLLRKGKVKFHSWDLVFFWSNLFWNNWSWFRWGIYCSSKN